MTPRIVYSPIGDRWYVATRYVEKTAASGAKHIVAIRKHDVTDQMLAILSQHGCAAVKGYLSGRLRMAKAPVPREANPGADGETPSSAAAGHTQPLSRGTNSRGAR